MPQQQRGLRRSIRPVTRSFKVLEKVDGPLNTNVSEDHDTNVETPNFQAIRVQKPKLKTDFRKQLDHLQRASTPSTLIEDFRYRPAFNFIFVPRRFFLMKKYSLF